uniref:SGNH hydrolase-type esterase domain-containing protein n=1 Tax=Lactuca sativa TaxID=4236 RepID=A0A9R1UW71_LACSA|nr:hypothetical protein LSAT_V11C800452090 [Lactuca sativa]
MAFAVFIFALLLKVSTALSSQNITHLFSVVLIFGDSTADSGNNNYINTPLKADHPPYGEDFPGKIPTGRFSNGKLEYIKILKKVVGIKVEGALVSISAGTNDFTISYYNLPSRRDNFSMDDYHDYILKKLQNFVNELYKIGRRTMVVSGLPPMRCLPIQMLSRFSRTCLTDQDTDARVYNLKFMKALPQIQSSLKESRIMYTDIYTPMTEMIRNPRKMVYLWN